MHIHTKFRLIVQLIFLASISILFSAAINGECFTFRGEPLSSREVLISGERNHISVYTNDDGFFESEVTAPDIVQVEFITEAGEICEVPIYEFYISPDDFIEGLFFEVRNIGGDYDAVIGGSVFNIETEEPAEDIHVFCYSDGRELNTYTNEDGHYEFVVHSDTWFEIHIEEEGYITSPSRHDGFPMPSDTINDFHFELISADLLNCSVSGRITLEDGTAVPDHPVWMESDDFRFDQFTDEDGYYRFDIIGDMWYSCATYHWELMPDPIFHVFFTYPDSHYTDINFVLRDLPEDAFVCGRVTFDDDSPIPDAEIVCRTEDWSVLYFANTDEEGFYFLPVNGGRDYEITCNYEGLMPLPESYFSPIMTGDSLTEIDFTMIPEPEPNSWITGRITTAGDEGIEEIHIEAFTESGMVFEGYSDHDGYYEIGVIAGEYYSLMIESWGFDPEPWRYDSIMPIEDEVSDGYDFILTGGWWELNISVNITDESGEPVENCVVTASREFDTFTDTTNASGMAVFSLFEAGSYNVTATFDDMLFAPLDTTVWVMWDFPAPVVYFTMIDTLMFTRIFISSQLEENPFPDLSINWRQIGSSEWNEETTDEFGKCIIFTPDTGSFEIRAFEPSGYYVLPAGAMFNLTTVARNDSITFNIYEDHEDISENREPSSYEIYISPNPFNSSCSIDNTSSNEIVIYDIYGKTIKKLEPGCNNWAPSKEIPSGIYLFRTLMDNQIIEKRVIYLK